MKSYIAKPKEIKKSQFSKKDFCQNSLCPKDYRQLNTINTNIYNLKDFTLKEYRGKEIGSDAYMKKSQYHFIKTTNITNDFCLNDNKVEYCKPINLIFPKKNDLLIVKDGAGDGLGEVSIYNKENISSFDTISSGILGLRVNNDYLYYILGLLKSQHFKDYINVNTAQGSTIRHSKEIAYEYDIPFPTKKQNKNPKDIEVLVSIITQNIIDKEEQIKLKNKAIDNSIEKELKENQKSSHIDYKYPKLSELKEEKRLDTVIYTSKYKNIENLILNYKNGYYFLSEDSISPGRTPKDYYFSETYKSDKFKDWITPKNIENRQLSFRTFIHTKSNTTIKKNSIVINGIRYVGNGVFIENEKEYYTNQNMLVINHFEDKMKQLFLFCFLTSKIGKMMQMARRNFGIVPILYTDSLCKIPIPNFQGNKQKEIVKKYYNEMNYPVDITLENYLEKNKKRNKALGIQQLNMEIFTLKEKLENIIDKIVMDKEIEIDDFL